MSFTHAKVCLQRNKDGRSCSVWCLCNASVTGLNYKKQIKLAELPLSSPKEKGSGKVRIRRSLSENMAEDMEIYIFHFTYVCCLLDYLCATCIQCPQWPEGGVRTPGAGVRVGAIPTTHPKSNKSPNCRASSPALRFLYFQVYFILIQSLVYVDLCVSCFNPVWGY